MEEEKKNLLGQVANNVARAAEEKKQDPEEIKKQKKQIADNLTAAQIKTRELSYRLRSMKKKLEVEKEDR